MAESNKTYRIRTTVGREADSFLEVKLDQDYDSLEILSLKISDKDTYKLHNSDYGVVVGRVLANGNFGVPNAKISVFIPADKNNSDLHMWELYPYTSTSTKNSQDIRYNLLPDESVKDCHKAVGTFPNKTYLLENDAILEVFDTYYIYTTRTNAAGDYLICGVPTGQQTLHMDLDLSDCGILSQRPRDFVYKGYTIEQFDNPNQFKKDENLDGLSQIFSQNQPVYVKPFWGNEDNGDEIGITRADIEISFKFEPTCVFMGSAISDNSSNGVGKKCVPTNQMGLMEELTAGEGTIEMIRKTPGGHVEEFSIKGNQLIDGNGVWCYQIPMNLDYMMTDEYGNMVPTDDPEKGIPTRARVRFRASLTDMENSSQSFYRAKYLIPNNPGVDDDKVDYNFGTYTEEDSFRDLFWNGVYTVKSYIPRFQKSKRWKSERFTGIKACNYYGGNNPMPYNNMRIRLPFMFTVLCIFVKLFIKIVALVNRLEAGVLRLVITVVQQLKNGVHILTGGVSWLINLLSGGKVNDWLDELSGKIINNTIKRYGLHCTFIGDGLCPDMEGWYFAPGCAAGIKKSFKTVADMLMENTLLAALGNGDQLDGEQEGKDAISSTEYTDETSTDIQNQPTSQEDSVCLTTDVDYLVSCFEMNLAQEYRVIKFDFYNDWVNGVLYFPRWMRKIKRKKKYKFSLKKGDKFITTYYKDKVKGCMNSENSMVKKSRYYTQQCSLSYARTNTGPWTRVTTSPTCYETRKSGTNIFPSKCHKKGGMEQSSIFGKKSGLVTEETTMLGQFVYYLKPCEWKDSSAGKIRTLLYATDIVLLGTLNDCDENGIPQAFKFLNNSSYIMPTNLALTTMDDDAYIYAAGDGTICASTNSTGPDTSIEPNVKRIAPDYASSTCAYTLTDGEQLNFYENDESIAVTEAAGISWNYSGPGQDDVPSGTLESPKNFIDRLFNKTFKRRDYLYYPGGHFLGLSCVNSDTNIKSCVNLKRICEVGSTMSQRREEIHSYDENGTPIFKYYVPTGLISNVDIEGASFRSMFATINHGKLVANERNEKTGYKKYTFRFLRPDGFDGLLSDFVHKANSPYNTKVNGENNNLGILKDETSIFNNLFGLITGKGNWTPPDDYDPHEVENTERRTVEDTINDYYMFRFGLDSFANAEQAKHYLKNDGGNYSLPQYENSFYFYFGLKDGATALDEFKKQFFSECAANKVMMTPAISIKENISETLDGNAALFIDNMLPTYTIVISDNTAGYTTDPIYWEQDSLDIDEALRDFLPSSYTGNPMIIGHEYTVTVTDSLDQTITKTFVFGASLVKLNVSTIHFRVPAQTSIPQSQHALNKGGYFKINNLINILGRDLAISDGTASFEAVESGSTTPVATLNSSSYHYTDAEGEVWYIMYVPKVGTYDLKLVYGDKKVDIYSVLFEDNTDVNFFVSCNFLAYKPGSDGAGNTYAIPGREAGLRGIREDEWFNSNTAFGDAGTQFWLLRHSLYRQTQNDTEPFNHYLYTNGESSLAIFGEPEEGDLTNGSLITPSATYFDNDYDQFPGYSLDERYSFVPTIYWSASTRTDWTGGDEVTANTPFRNAFDVMSYTKDGRAAADASSVKITNYSYSDGVVILTCTSVANMEGFVIGHGCLVVLENGVTLFPIIKSNTTLEARYPYDVYPDGSATSALLDMATVYPTMRVPSMYKPFYGLVSAATWNVQSLILTRDEDNVTVPTRTYLPISYKVEGKIYNGLTRQEGVSTTGYFAERGTYLNNSANTAFRNSITARTDQDYLPKRELAFGQDTSGNGFCREITTNDGTVEDLTEIIYTITEGTPGTPPMRAMTGRYRGGFDAVTLTDSCDLTSVFDDGYTIKVFNGSSGLSGPCAIHATREITDESFKLYRTNVKLFNMGSGPMKTTDPGGTYLLGMFNERAANDTKGEKVSISLSDGNSKYSCYITNSAGTKVNVKVDVGNYVDSDTADTKTQGEVKLEASGVSMAHQYTLKPEYMNNLSGITDVIANNSTEIDVVTDYNPGNSSAIFTGTGVQTIIAVYDKQEEGSRNKMTVIKLYPIGSLDIMYPINDGGVEAYLSTDTEVTATSEAHDITLSVATNVSFSVASSDQWISFPSGTSFPASATSVRVRLTANEGTSERTGTVTFTATQQGVSLTVTVTIHQEPASE